MPGNESDKIPGRRRLLIPVVSVLAAVALVAGLVLWLGGPADQPAAQAQPKGDLAAKSAGSAKVDLASLPASDTYATVKAAPTDPKPRGTTSGEVIHPKSATAVYDAPDGKPIAKVKPKQLGDTWLPVIAKRDGWVHVLLPSKPNGSTGWLRADGLRKAVTPYVIRVHLSSMTLELERDGKSAGSWTVGIGKASTPTPTGRTFLLGSFTDEDQDFSPVILPLGSHSKTLDSFGGGPGTVAIHSWPTTDVLGTATSHGCIRVPQDALKELAKVPLGTVVLVDED